MTASDLLGPTIAQMLMASRLDPEAVCQLIRLAIDEDLDGGVDVTSVATVPVDQMSVLDFVARKPGVIAGVPVAAAVFMIVCADSDVAIDFASQDGDEVAAGELVLSVRSTTHALLQAERPALNFLSHLSGIATLTHEWAAAIRGTGAAIRDTRKTTPGFRALEKYAVRCGGGVNHRMSLSDAALVKDNHVLAAGGVAEAFALVRSSFPGVPVEVEVDSLEQLREVVSAGADLVLLDNFTIDQTRDAVAFVDGRARLEASGGLTLDVAHAVAATGVDYLAVGALTHSAPVLDIGADLRQAD
ncbi:MAG: carboxylating nicotinate-nucleotide diphosphorylase [Actinomycetota bacterium]|nr:carboxylating nicotinate-nucleotide diphosphorylase [Actinomycetota bacterium]